MAAIKCCGVSQSAMNSACQRASCARPPKLLRAQSDSVAIKLAQSRAREIETLLATSTIDPSAAKDKANTPLGQYANRYLQSLAGQIAQRTIDGYAALYRVHIGPAFGSRPIGSILPSDVQSWHATLLATSPTRKQSTRNPKTARQALGVLRRIFNHAALDSAVTSNPAAIKLNSTHKRRTNTFRHQPLSPEQIASLADYVATQQNSPVYALAITFAAYTGVRAAELAGLQVGDLTLSDHHGTLALSASNARKPKWQGNGSPIHPRRTNLCG